MGDKNARPKSRRLPRGRELFGAEDNVGATPSGGVGAGVERLSDGVSRDLLRTQTKVDVGWVVSWHTFNPEESTRARTSTCEAGRGTVVSAVADYVMVRASDNRRKQVRLPRKRIQDPARPESDSSSSSLRTSSRSSSSRHSVVGASILPRPSKPGIFQDGRINPRLKPKTELQYAQQELEWTRDRHAGEVKQLKQRAIDERKALKKENATLAQKFEKEIAVRDRKIKEEIALREEEIALRDRKIKEEIALRERKIEEEIVVRKLCEGQVAKLEAQIEKSAQEVEFMEGGAMKEKWRDLAVKFQVEQGYPAHTVFHSVRMVLETAGVIEGEVGGGKTKRKRKQQSQTADRALRETAIMLEDVQARLMAEESRKWQPDLQIRPKDWRYQWVGDGAPPPMPGAYAPPSDPGGDFSLAEFVGSLEKHYEGMHDKKVSMAIQDWMHRLDYKPEKHLPDPKTIDVGELAQSEEDFEAAKCAVLFGGVDGTQHGRNDRDVLGCNVGGYAGAPEKGAFAFLQENLTGIAGPRHELQTILDYLQRVRRRQCFLGYPPKNWTYLYDIPVWVVRLLRVCSINKAYLLLLPFISQVDNCNGNRGEKGGLLVMIELVRRLEYLFLKATSRKNIGKYIETITNSCQLHDSNLINVELSRILRNLDLTKVDPFQPHRNPAVEQARFTGQKNSECWSIMTARFVASAIKKSKDWKAFMLTEYGDAQGIKSVKSARFWSVMIIMGTYLYPRMKYLREFADVRRADLEGTQLGKTLADLEENWELFEFDCLLERVDYDGFHSRFNWGAANLTAEKQAYHVKRIVSFHEKCTKDNPAGKAARDLYWRGNVVGAIVERRVKEFTCDRFAQTGSAPGKRAIRQQKARVLASLTEADLTIPRGCLPRVKAMHAAVVKKCKQFLAPVVATGTVGIAVKRSGAVSNNMRVEYALLLSPPLLAADSACTP